MTILGFKFSSEPDMPMVYKEFLGKTKRLCNSSIFAKRG